MLGAWRIYHRDPAVGDRYDFTDYTLYAFVWPISGDVKFEWERDGWRWRKKLKSTLTFKDDSVFHSYCHFKEIEDGDDKCDDWVLALVDADADILWKGFINYTTWEVDEDRGYVKMTAEVFDDYSIFYENKDRQFNLMNASGTIVEPYANFNVNFDNMDAVNSWRPARVEWFIQYGAYYIEDGVKYAGVKDIQYGGVDVWWDWITAGGYTIYARDLAMFEKQTGVGCTPSSDPEWIDAGTAWIGLSEYCIYAREPLTYPSGSITVTNSSTGNCPDTPGSGTTWLLLYDGSEDPVEGGDDIVNIWCNRTTGLGQYGNVRFVKDVIEWMLSEIGFAGSYSSVFFDNESGDIMYGHDAEDYCNKRLNLMIAQKSDIRVGLDYVTFKDTTVPEINHATRGNITLQELFDMLGIFSTDWYIDDEGDFRIEHQKYFEFGENYLAPIYPIEHDISTTYGANKNHYTYQSDELPKYERFKFMEALNYDFVGVDIYYNTPCVSYNPKNNVKEYLFDKVTTDLKYINTNPDDISRDGFCLLAYMDINGADWVASERGKLSKSMIINGHLSWANLHHYYWRYGRVVEVGYLNDEEVSFESWTKQKLQTEIAFPFCHTDELNPYYLWVTALGNGYLDSAEEDIKLEILKIKLRYA